MGKIVAAVAASHAPGLVGLRDKAPAELRERMEGAYHHISQTVRNARPDVLIVLGNDHLANSRILEYPDYLIGMASEHVGPHEWFKPWLGVQGPDYHVPGNPAVAETLFSGFSKAGIRVVGRRGNLAFDDNVSTPIILGEFENGETSLVPILMNCTVPPVPDQYRQYAFGQVLKQIIEEDLPVDFRVALYGSGGLSHEPGGSRYFYIDKQFDEKFLRLLNEGDHDKILQEMTYERMEDAGAGGTAEILAWFPILGAVGNKPCKTIFYTGDVEEWKCGIGVVEWLMEESDR